MYFCTKIKQKLFIMFNMRLRNEKSLCTSVWKI